MPSPTRRPIVRAIAQLSIACLLLARAAFACAAPPVKLTILSYHEIMVWYPLAFWLINIAATVVAYPRALLMRGRRARWVSPDRGAHLQGADGGGHA